MTQTFARLRTLHRGVGLLILVSLLAHLFLEVVPLPDYPGDIMLGNFIDFSRERSMITWLSAVLWFAAAATTAMIALVQSTPNRHSTKWWLGFSLVPLIISIDEVAGIHETLSVHIRQASDAQSLDTVSWIIPELALALAVSIPFIGFLRRLPRWLAIQIVLAAAVAGLGAIGLEFTSALFDASDSFGRSSKAYAVTSAIEESLELLGAYILLGALARYLERTLLSAQTERARRNGQISEA